MPGPSGVKLRDSCESCAASKVRCSKEKPTCHRCTERGTLCQYSIQQRTGRKFRHREPGQDCVKDATLSQVDPPLTSASPFFPELDTATDLSLFDSSFGALDSSSILPMSSDGFNLSQSNSVIPSQDLLSNQNIYPDQTKSHAAGSSVLNDADVSSQTFESFLSASSEPGADSDEFGLASSVSSFLTAPLAPQFGATLHGTSTQPSDSLEIALQLMHQLSCGEDHHLVENSIATSLDHQKTEPPHLLTVLDKNKMAIEAVRSTLQTTNSHNGYLLVVVCLVVSKVLTAYESTVRTTCTRGNDGRASSTSAPSISAPSTSALSASPEQRDPTAAQRVLDQLYHVQASMDELGAKMQQWAKRNRASGTEAFPIGNDMTPTTVAGFPFSATVMNQLYTEVRKRLSTLSLKVIDELKRYWT
ncbi:MAG: hypothetical protein Q9204_005627 [Flavoplaca sp. TL-2023a]